MLAGADASIMVKKCQKMVSAIANRALPSGMSEIVSELEGGQEIAEDRAECEREERIQFQMIQRGDFIKAGWWHWRCRREDEAGEAAYGYVQADSLGRVIAPETFEKDKL
jgi:hypothetical protein